MPFTVTVKVYDQNKKSLIDTKHNPTPYIVYIWLINNSTGENSSNLIGNTTNPTVNNTATFAKLNITDIGDYIIYADVIKNQSTAIINNLQIQSSKSSMFTIIWIVSSISAHPVLSSTSCYFIYNIAVYPIWNDNNGDFFGELSVFFSDNETSINGELTGNITSTSGEFPLYFNSSGTKNVTITTISPSVVSTSIIVIVKSSSFTISIPTTVIFILACT